MTALRPLDVHWAVLCPNTARPLRSFHPDPMSDDASPDGATRSPIEAPSDPDWARPFDLAVKLALVAAFVIAIAIAPDSVEGKNMAARAPLFLAPAVLVPVLARARRWEPYPWLADGLLSLAFLLDTLGNLFGFYDEFVHTDDVLHLVNWVLLVLAFHAFRYRNVHDHRDAVLLGYGFGAIMIIAWETFEWFISDDGPLAAGVPDALSLSYGDTIGDLVISSTGGLLGSLIGRWWLGRTWYEPRWAPHGWSVR